MSLRSRLIGSVKAKEYLAASLTDEANALRQCLKQPLFVPQSRSALQTLELFKDSLTHMALIVDEHGALKGLVTTNDILEAIVGDLMLTAGQTESYAVQRDDGSWLLDGALPLDEFKEIFRIEKLVREEKKSYQTLAGFILMYLGHVPAAAEHFEWNGLRFEVVDLDGNRIDKVLV